MEGSGGGGVTVFLEVESSASVGFLVMDYIPGWGPASSSFLEHAVLTGQNRQAGKEVGDPSLLSGCSFLLAGCLGFSCGRKCLRLF